MARGYAVRDKARSTHLRRAKTAGVPGSFDKWDVQIRLSKQGQRCHYCGASLITYGPGKYQIDHFIPLSRGGSNYASNIVLACPACNLSKGGKLPHEFMPERFSAGGGRDA